MGGGPIIGILGNLHQPMGRLSHMEDGLELYPNQSGKCPSPAPGYRYTDTAWPGCILIIALIWLIGSKYVAA